MIDKNYCMSSYLAFRYIVDDDKDFKEGINHRLERRIVTGNEKLVYNADDIAEEYKRLFEEKEKQGIKMGLLLSGGMDSACLAPFMKPGTDCYTFRYPNNYRIEELKRAEEYAKRYHHILHYVDINWNVVEKNVDLLMAKHGAPVHSIQPQMYEAAIQAKKDGVELMVTGCSSDYTFGGMDKILSKDWDFDEWKDFIIFTKPESVLKEPVSFDNLFEKYRLPNNKIDYFNYCEDIFDPEEVRSYKNSFESANMKYDYGFDPANYIRMGEPLDLNRVRNGESKYLIRDLFKKCYPDIPVPEKIPMPRPVDYYFKDWKGPTRPEFIDNLDMSNFTGNQKWQIWCLERFLNNIEKYNGRSN